MSSYFADDDELGVVSKEFDYVSGPLTGPGSIITVGICKGIRIKAVGGDAKFAISGGNIITVRSGDIFQIVPQAILTNASIDWFSGSMDVWMEVEGATPPTAADLGLSLGIAHL
jgi:hypothetical protein